MTDIIKMREQLNKWMEDDQKIKNPVDRITPQRSTWWPYIYKNMNDIFLDCGEKKDGDYPSSSFAAWLLVQHMDANPEYQRLFFNKMKSKVPNHIKRQFLEDRVKVNEWVIKNYRNPKYYRNGKPLDHPTINIRNPAFFNDAKIIANSQQEALKNAERANNLLLVDAVKSTRAQTQPSYMQR